MRSLMQLTTTRGHQQLQGARSARVHCRHGGATCGAAAAGAELGVLSARQLDVKLGIAASIGKLDLSDCRLEHVPPEVFDLPDLTELSLAGNQLRELPANISSLTALERLVIAGNQLRELPPQLGALTALQGLWAHGNLLEDLGPGLGALVSLSALSLAGNRLARVPNAIGALTRLSDLSLSGNRLAQLPSLAGLAGLKKLVLNGNQLTQVGEVPPGVQELMLQGNCLEGGLPPALCEVQALTELVVSDNHLSSLPTAISRLTSLQKLHAYGNRLASLPVDALAALPALRALWLEGNPLSGNAVAALLAAAPHMRTLSALGLDEAQLAGLGGAAAAAAAAAVPALRVGLVQGEGRGYFKLHRGPSSGSGAGQRVLLVAFGSAPGTPNWGGLVQKLYAAAKEPRHSDFDVLYVVDPERAWYYGGDPEAMDATYTRRLAHCTQAYNHVVMVGDSMGATAALLFAPLATTVLAFCPQVDLSTSSIRPGQPAPWMAALTESLERSVAAAGAAGAALRLFTGTWQHDVDQVNLLVKQPGVVVKVYSVGSHRLALALARQDRLLPLVREAMLQEMGVNTGNVRPSNLL